MKIIKATDNTDLVNQLKRLKINQYAGEIELDVDFEIGTTAKKYIEKEYPELLEPKLEPKKNNNVWCVSKDKRYWCGSPELAKMFIKKGKFEKIVPISELPKGVVNNG